MVPPGTVIRGESDLDPVDRAPSGYFVLLAEIGKSRKIWVNSCQMCPKISHQNHGIGSTDIRYTY